MRKLFLLVLLLASVASAGHWQCYTTNSYGYQFWGTGYTQYAATSNAVSVCQMNTPFGARCYVDAICNWVY
jgi:hypothetical protein